ncbi:MAG: hypothetical protein ACI9VT_000292 [Psychroserpens sp.]|jgi:hypothetical protein
MLPKKKSNVRVNVIHAIKRSEISRFLSTGQINLKRCLWQINGHYKKYINIFIIDNI